MCDFEELADAWIRAQNGEDPWAQVQNGEAETGFEDQFPGRWRQALTDYRESPGLCGQAKNLLEQIISGKDALVQALTVPDESESSQESSLPEQLGSPHPLTSIFFGNTDYPEAAAILQQMVRLLAGQAAALLARSEGASERAVASGDGARDSRSGARRPRRPAARRAGQAADAK